MPVIDRPSASVVPQLPDATPVTPTPTTTTVSDAQPTGLDAATNAGPAPAAGGVVSNAVGTVGGVLAKLVDAPSGPPKLGLLPGYPQCVSLPDVMAKLGQSPAGAAALQGVFAKFQAETGVEIPAALAASIEAHPERIADAFVVTPRQMKAGFEAVNDAYRSGKLKPTAPKVRQLPNAVDLSSIDYGSIKRPAADLKALSPTTDDARSDGPGLFQGDVPSSLPDDQAQKNIAAAEIFDRLAENAGFSVTYQGKSCTSVGDLLQALKDDGCKVSARIDYRAADFAALKIKNPAAPDGVLDVPAAVLVRTGIRDANGKEAVLPAIHGELIFHVEKGPDTKGPGMDADFKWYQGMPDTGFFPDGVNRRSSWLGRKTTCTFEGDDAIKAAKLAANDGDVINTAARKDGLWGNGYGVTGVCLDSVGTIEMALTGKVNGFPLFGHDQIVLGEIDARLHDQNYADDADLRTLAGALEQLPHDDKRNASQKERIIASLPWTDQNAPVQCVKDAQAILGV